MFAAAISDYILRQNLNKSMKMIDLASIQMSEILDYKLSSFFSQNYMTGRTMHQPIRYQLKKTGLHSFRK